MAIRSGRFKVAIADITQGVLIIKGRQGALFRVFNSGSQPLVVKAQGSTEELAPTFSIDLATGPSGSGEVVITANANGEVVEGIYDYLDPQNSIRSGRFNIKLTDHAGNTVDPTVPHKIIAFKGGNPIAWYRIFNSGDNPIVVQKNGTTDLATVDADQSFDFAVAPSSNSITVKSTASNLPIEGIYEFLGAAN